MRRVQRVPHQCIAATLVTVRILIATTTVSAASRTAGDDTATRGYWNRKMAFWWVNHKQTRDHEVRGGYLWSPMRNANGAFNQTYHNMTFVRPGDVVFSYAHGQIGAVGQVTEAASASPKPNAKNGVRDTSDTDERNSLTFSSIEW